jgi:hypothetical protein
VPSTPAELSDSNRVEHDLPGKLDKEIAHVVDAPVKEGIAMSETGSTKSAPVAKPRPTELVESVPMLFCWALLGVSALLLTIQLWTYFF